MRFRNNRQASTGKHYRNRHLSLISEKLAVKGYVEPVGWGGGCRNRVRSGTERMRARNTVLVQAVME